MEILEEAIQKLKSGNVDEGLNMLKYIAKNSKDKALLYEVAATYSNYGFLEEALDLARKLLKQHPDEEEFILLAADCFIELGDDLQAIEYLDAIKKSSGYYLTSLLMLADLYQMQGLEEVAENKLLEAYNLNKKEPIVWYALAEFYLSQGEYYKASLYYEKLLKDKEFSADETVNLHFAETLTMLGQFEQALPYYEKGLKSENNLDGLFRYGYTAYKAENYEKAIEILTKLHELDPQYTTLYPILANAYVQTKQMEKALEILKEGLAYDEFNSELYVFISKLYMQTGKHREAEEYLQKALALNTPSLEAIETYLTLLKEKDDCEGIIEFIQQLKDKHDDIDPVLDWELAKAHEQLENFDEAHKYYKACYPYLENDSQFLEQYGYFLMEEGYIEEAKTCFQKALNIDGQLFHLEELIEELENKL